MPVDPCAEAERLRAIRTEIISGRSESQVRFGDEEVRYQKSDLAALNREIARLEAECAGETKPTRYAKGFRFGRVC